LFVAPLVLPLPWLGVFLAVAAPLPSSGLALGWAAWLMASALLGVVGWFAALPGAVLATGRPSLGFALGWYLMLGCWIAARSADVRALGARPRQLQGAALVAGVASALVVLAPGGGSTSTEV